MDRYIGVTGFMSREEVNRALGVVPRNTKRRLMVGVLASGKSIRNRPLKPEWQGRYPKASAIRTIFTNDRRALNLVHFAPGDEYAASLVPDMNAIAEMAGPLFGGFQLNAVWPKPTDIGGYREGRGFTRDVLVLQIGRAALREMDGDVVETARRVQGYNGLIDGVLVDPSGGKGAPLDAATAHDLITAIVRRCPHLGIGVAGGLGADSLDLLGDLPAQFPSLSIDAEGRLRTADGALDEPAVGDYLQSAYRLMP